VRNRNRRRARPRRATNRRNHSRRDRVRRNHASAFAVVSTPSFISTVERKARTVYATPILNGQQENFYGEVVAPTLPPFTISIPSPDPGAAVSAQLQISLQGLTQQDHLVKVFL